MGSGIWTEPEERRWGRDISDENGGEAGSGDNGGESRGGRDARVEAVARIEAEFAREEAAAEGREITEEEGVAATGGASNRRSLQLAEPS